MTVTFLKKVVDNLEVPRICSSDRGGGGKKRCLSASLCIGK